MKPRVMLDTGALIALERGQYAMRKVHRLAVEQGYAIVTTTPVIAEWWRRGRREKERLAILRTLVLEAPDAVVARLAGAAFGIVGGGVVDALVMASASIRGDTVYTSDRHRAVGVEARCPSLRRSKDSSWCRPVLDPGRGARAARRYTAAGHQALDEHRSRRAGGCPDGP